MQTFITQDDLGKTRHKSTVSRNLENRLEVTRIKDFLMF